MSLRSAGRAFLYLFTSVAVVWGVGTSANKPFDFAEVAVASGVRFVLENGPTANKYMIQTMPGGVAVFDYNGDGRPDIFFANGADVPGFEKSDPKYWNRLYRNEGNLRFTDVTDAAGVRGAGYSTGVAVGDYDNDGYPDLFVTGVDHQTLYRNLGSGKFEDVTARARVGSDQWAVAAGFFDYDLDGKLDLLVVRYSSTPLSDRFCGDSARAIRVYCHPRYFPPLAPLLYRNRGDGTFEDTSKRSGLANIPARGMSAAFADYDRDGYPDIVISNDNLPTLLFHNRGNGTFEEVGLEAGVALGDRAQPVAGMGVDFRDYNNDGLPDLSITALAGETFPLFRNLGHGAFADTTYSSRLGRATVPHSGWGSGFADFDNDGWKDLFAADSHVNDRVESFEAYTYKESNQVFRNLSGSFIDSTPDSMRAAVAAHRGSAIADLDGDGKLDIVTSSLNAAAEVWHNTTKNENQWIEFRLHGINSNRDGIGATIRIGKQWNDMTSATGYSSASLSPVHFGLGASVEARDIEIRWPSGRLQKISRLAAGRVFDITEPDR